MRAWSGRIALAALPALLALNLATSSDVVGIDAVDEFVRVLAASVVLFGLAGFGLTRFFLPDGLRGHEWLWVLPVGAAAVAFAMTPIGFLGIPFAVNLGIVLAAATAGSGVAVARRGLPSRPEFRALAWPAYLALLLCAVALIPMFRAGFATVTGEGSDAHLAAGTGEFLRHAGPLEVDERLPVDQVPLVWRSKQAIYYAFGAVTTLSGLETWQTLSALAAILLALAAVGFFVVAREMLGVGVGVAATAMAIAGLDRMVLHTGMHPYFNQTWGYFTLPFSLVLSWWVIRHWSLGGALLLALFLFIGAFAYPLAVPIPLLVLTVMWWWDRRARKKRGEEVIGRKEVWRRFRALPRKVRWPGYVLAFLLLTPLFGAFEKFSGAMQLLLNTNHSLELWGGDLSGWFPERQFFAIHATDGWWVALIVIVAFCLLELRRLPKPVAIGIGTVLVVGGLIALEMRLRDYGYYFHFKILAFIGPVVIVLAAASMSRVRRWHIGTALLVLWVMWAHAEARIELQRTFDQVPLTVQELEKWSDGLPAGSSVRLDMNPGSQLWAAYMLADHPLCSQRPLSTTSYPHVPLSRKADYVVSRGVQRPFDAVGTPLRENKEFRLWRLRADLPGEDRCSQKMIQTVSKIQRFQ